MSALVRCSLDKWDDSAIIKETNAFISAKFMGLVKSQLASCQRQLIKTWEADASAPRSGDQVATINAPAAAL